MELVDAVEDAGLPPIRVGVTRGEALQRGGDWFGRSVNLASRVCAVARPGSLLATQDAREAAGDDAASWSFAGARKIRGVSGETKLHRARAT